MMTSTLFGSFKRIAVSVLVLAGIALAQTPNLDTNIKGSRWPAFGTDSGAANAYVLTTVAPLGPGLRTGSCFEFFAAHANTAASTLNVDSTGAIAIKKSVSSALAAGDIVLNGMTQVCYDGTNYQLVFSPGYFAGIAGGVIPKSCLVTIGDPGAGSSALVDTDDAPAQCGNDLGSDITITAASCWADAGSPTVTPILTGGSGTSILTGALTCGTASWAAGTVNGTPTLHSFSSNGATCSSTPCTLDANITSAGGTAKYIVMKFTGSAVFGVSPGTGTVTSVGTGTGLSGGPITGTGTISLANTAVTPGSYTSTDLTVDAQGRITAAANGAGGGSSVSVNGSSVSSPNFNGTTPAAASNNLNVTWQVSSSSVSAQVAAATNSTLGLIKSATCASNNWISSITTGTGAIGCSQPAFSNLSGSANLATQVTGVLPVVNGGSGSSSPAIVAGSNVTVSGSWPNQTINAAGGGGGGVASPGPDYAYLQCTLFDITGTNFTSRNCASTVNETVRDYLLATCTVFTNSGTPTLSFSNTHADTWTTLANYYSSNTGYQEYVFGATAGSSGADTFTCTISASNAYWTISVQKLNNVTALDTSSTYQTTATISAAAPQQDISTKITTAHTNELAFFLQNASGAGLENSLCLNGSRVWTSTAAVYLCTQKLAATGDYLLSTVGNNTGNYSAVVFSLY